MNRAELFSRQAGTYARFRPTYPPELFAFLAATAPRRELAWDCATGNGQAAIGLADHFAHVIATDAGAAMIARAQQHPKVEYRVANAERCGLPDASVDLVTVAQALHWFDLDAFYTEVRRVSHPGGVLAVTVYPRAGVSPETDAIVRRFDHETMRDYWAPGSEHVYNVYDDLPFPFARVATPKLTIEMSWSLEDLLGYLRSWSAVQTYIDRHGVSPLESLAPELAAAWGDPARRRRATWELRLICGRVGGP